MTLNSMFESRHHTLELILATTGALALGAGAAVVVIKVIDRIRTPLRARLHPISEGTNGREETEAITRMEGEGGTSKLSEAGR